MINIFSSTYKNVVRLLPQRFKRRLVLVQLVIFISSLADLLGLALFIPIISIITNQDKLKENGALADLKALSQIESDSDFLLALFIIVFLFFILRSAVIIWCNWFQNKFVFDLSEYLGVSAYNFYLSSSFESFQKRNSAEIVRELTVNPQHFARFLVMPLLMLTTEFLVIFFILLGISIYNIEVLLMLMLTVFPVAYLFNRSIKLKMRQFGEDQNYYTPILYSASIRGMFGYMDVKLRNKEQSLIDDYKSVFATLNTINLKTSVLAIMPAKLLEVVTVLGLLLLFVYSLFFSEDPSSVVSLIVIYAAAGYRIVPSLSRIIPSFMQLEQYQYLFKIFADPTQHKSVLNHKQDEVSFTHSIVLEDIAFAFNDSKDSLFNNVNLEIAKGQILGLIGKSGEGKTTLVQIISGFLIQSQGSILIDGIKLTSSNVVSWMSKISYVQQSPYLESGSLTKNIAFLDNDIDVERLNRAIEQASLKSFVNGRDPNQIILSEGGKNLSGGQKQRIIIARALYHQAELIILDEATSALDSETEEVISETVSKLKGSGVTILIIAHRMTSLIAADRIVEVKNGIVLECEKRFK